MPEDISFIDSSYFFYEEVPDLYKKAGLYYCEKKKNGELTFIWLCSHFKVKSLKNNSRDQKCYELQFLHSEMEDVYYTRLIPTNSITRYITRHKDTLAYEGL